MNQIQLEDMRTEAFVQAQFRACRMLRERAKAIAGTPDLTAAQALVDACAELEKYSYVDPEIVPSVRDVLAQHDGRVRSSAQHETTAAVAELVRTQIDALRKESTGEKTAAVSHFARLLGDIEHGTLRDGEESLTEYLDKKLEPYRRENEELRGRVKELIEACASATQGSWIWADADDNDLASLAENTTISITAKTLRILLTHPHVKALENELSAISLTLDCADEEHPDGPFVDEDGDLYGLNDRVDRLRDQRNAAERDRGLLVDTREKLIVELRNGLIEIEHDRDLYKDSYEREAITRIDPEQWHAIGAAAASGFTTVDHVAGRIDISPLTAMFKRERDNHGDSLAKATDAINTGVVTGDPAFDVALRTYADRVREEFRALRPDPTCACPFGKGIDGKVSAEERAETWHAWRYSAEWAVRHLIAIVGPDLVKRIHGCGVGSERDAWIDGLVDGARVFANTPWAMPDFDTVRADATAAYERVVGVREGETFADAVLRRLAEAREEGRQQALATPESIAGPKRPEYEPRTPEEKLGYLVEECGESLVPLSIAIGRVLSAVGKALRRGCDGYNPEIPEDQRETNAAWLLRELADLKVAIARAHDYLRRFPSDPRELRFLDGATEYQRANATAPTDDPRGVPTDVLSQAQDPSDVELLRRAVKSPPSSASSPKVPRWSGVAHVFAIGSTSARSLCRRFDLEPDEMLGLDEEDDDVDE